MHKLRIKTDFYLLQPFRVGTYVLDIKVVAVLHPVIGICFLLIYIECSAKLSRILYKLSHLWKIRCRYLDR